MSRHMYFHREIDRLKQLVLEMGGLVEKRVREGCALLESHDIAAAKALANKDWEIDEMAVSVEEECLKILALHQPVARDLRLIVAIMKINIELERIADFAVNISKRVISFSKYSQTEEYIIDYGPMAIQVLDMLKVSLDSLVTEDNTLARKIFVMDEVVDSFLDHSYKKTIQNINETDELGEVLVNVYLVARHLERIGDRVCNIAEEVLYLTEGEIVRTSSNTI